MTNMLDKSIVLTSPDSLRKGVVQQLSEAGSAQVRLHGSGSMVECLALESEDKPVSLAVGDQVLVWLEQSDSAIGVVLGRIAKFRAPGARPKTLTLEADEDIVIRNKHAKIKISAAGDIEFVGNSLVSRSQRLLRLLAPLIKLN